jgi:hypothetical protein
MNTPIHLTEKTPMTNTVLTSDRSRSIEMNLINEAMSRARTRRPQEQSEAIRSARRVAMSARRQEARELGDLSQLVIR